MIVNIDAQIFGLQSRGGISRYFVELVRAFKADPSLDIDVRLLWGWTVNAHSLDAGYGKSLPKQFAACPQVARALNWGLRHRLRGAEITHHTYYDPRYLLPRDAGKSVVTVYDMIPELFPTSFSRRSPHAAKRMFCDNADLVISISETTKRDLVRMYGLLPASIRVIPLGVDTNFRPGGRPVCGWPEHYVLFVGRRSTYKDFTVALKAFARVAAAYPRLHLMAVGGGPFDKDESIWISGSDLSGRIHQVDLSDADLSRAYAHAAVFVFPSRYEGFGLPAVEAMASGCPAVLSASPALEEVGGEAALFFRPGDVESLAETMSRILVSDDLRERLSNAGQERAKSFTWARTAELTAHAYRSTAN